MCFYFLWNFQGMGAGLSKYVTVNLEQIDALELGDGALVNLEILKVLGVVNPSGRERKLPLKVCDGLILFA